VETIMASVDAAVATFKGNIEARTGRFVADGSALVDAQGLGKHGAMVAWLKATHALGHGDANHIAKRALERASPRSDADPVAHLFDGGKESLRPLYDQLVAARVALGTDVQIAPKKANVSVRRRKPFALVQPTTKTRLDLGLILKDAPPRGRLEASGSFNAMFTHRVKLSHLGDIDAEVLAWLRAAYEMAD
jgi:hypothetical protein